MLIEYRIDVNGGGIMPSYFMNDKFGDTHAVYARSGGRYGARWIKITNLMPYEQAQREMHALYRFESIANLAVM